MLALSSCSNSQTETKTEVNNDKSSTTKVDQKKQVKKIAKDVKSKEFDRLVAEEQAVLVDVRTPGEFNAGHIEGAVNVNIADTDFLDQMLKLDLKKKSVALYCRSGGRSGRAMKMLNKEGYSELYNLLGGYMNYPNK